MKTKLTFTLFVIFLFANSVAGQKKRNLKTDIIASKIEFKTWSPKIIDSPTILPGPFDAWRLDNTLDYDYKNGSALLATLNGAFQYDIKTGNAKIIRDVDGLNSNFIRSARITSEGNMLFFCDAGITYYNIKSHYFTNYSNIIFDRLKHAGLRNIKNEIWFFGIEKEIEYLYNWNEKKRNFIRYTLPISANDKYFLLCKNTLLSNEFTLICDGKIIIFNIVTKKFKLINIPKAMFEGGEIQAYKSKNNDIWIKSLKSNKVSCYSLSSKKIVKFERIEDEKIIDLYEHAGDIWVSTKKGIFKISAFNRVPIKVYLPKAVISSWRAKFLLISDEHIFFTDSITQKLYTYNNTTGLRLISTEEPLNTTSWIKNCVQISKNVFAIASHRSLYFYNYETNTKKTFEFNSNRIIYNEIAKIFASNKGDIYVNGWIRGRTNDGIGVRYIFAPKKISFNHKNNTELSFKGTSRIEIKNFYEAKSGAVWFNHENIGESQWNGYHPIYKYWSKNYAFDGFSNNEGLSAIDVIEDSTENIWILKENGLYKSTWKTKKLIKVNLAFNILSIARESDSTMLLGTNSSVIRLNSRTMKPTNSFGLIDNAIIDKKDYDLNNVGHKSLLADSHGNIWYCLDNKIFKYEKKTKLFTNITVVEQNCTFYEDKNRHLWAYSESSIYNYSRSREKFVKIIVANLKNERFDFNVHGILPDSSGSIWYSDSFSLFRQTWNNDSTPARRNAFPLLGKEPLLASISNERNGKYNIWRTRPTGILLNSQFANKAFQYETIYPINKLEGGTNGGLWIGYSLYGLTFLSSDGTKSRFMTSNGLPDSSVLDISQVPNDNSNRAWVGTNNGAALVSPTRVLQKAIGINGPVDVVLATPKSGAFLALNPIDSLLALKPTNGFRRYAVIRHVDANGVLGQELEVPRGNVLDMALSANGKTVWVGTTTGLYKMVDGAFVRVNANNQFPPLPIKQVIVDPNETVWMAVDGQQENFASVYGYRPDDDDIKIFTTENGLLKSKSIDMIGISPEGDLIVYAAGKLVKGNVFVPKNNLTLYLLLALVFGAGAVGIPINLKRKKEETKKYQPLLKDSKTFFGLSDRVVAQADYRTLQINDKSKSGNLTSITASLCLDQLVSVETIIQIYKAIHVRGEKDQVSGYIIFPHELNPAARRQLDIYKIQQYVTIIPIPITFIRSKILEGEHAVREALDGLHRRYLGQQDLFDMRNALDESRFFFGRKSFIEDLQNTLFRNDHVALIGHRKIGKSSLLNLLRQRFDSFPVIMLDLQLYNRNNRNWPTQAFANIIRSYDEWGKQRFGNSWIAAQVGDRNTDGTWFSEMIFERKILKEKLGNTQSVVLLIDEMERIFPQITPDEVKNYIYVDSYNEFTGTLRALCQEGGNRMLSLVIADRQPAFNQTNYFQLSNTQTNPFYRFFKEFYVVPLEKEECREMISDIGFAMGIESIEEIVLNKIFTHSGGYPSLARQLASSANKFRGSEKILTQIHYENGLRHLQLESSELDMYFKENIWREMGINEQFIIAKIAKNESFLNRTSWAKSIPNLIGENLSLKNVELTKNSLLVASRFLIATKVVINEQGKYSILSSLFEDWLKENVEFIVQEE